ncbi:MAG: protein-tyrosine phosphatase family protein [Thermoplasmatota archaeon]
MDHWFHRFGGLTPIQGSLYRSPLPYVGEHFEILRKGGIEVIYSLEHAVPGDLARSYGFDWRPHFWTDDQPPTPQEMDRFLADFLALPRDTSALVHCKAGWGRTGTAITCALIAREGWSAEKALSHFWSRVPASESIMKSNGQADFVYGFAARRQGRGLG